MKQTRIDRISQIYLCLRLVVRTTTWTTASKYPLCYAGVEPPPRNAIASGSGMTETCAGAIFNLDGPDYDIQKGRSASSLGKYIHGIEMPITVPGHDMQLAASNEPGHLEIRGDVVFKGYYRNPLATAEAFTPDGWFRTGDQATIDDKGYLSLIDRVKDVVNINEA
jgi:long-subunit acyl-CoA synthetase (AMP-forming)